MSGMTSGPDFDSHPAVSAALGCATAIAGHGSNRIMAAVDLICNGDFPDTPEARELLGVWMALAGISPRDLRSMVRSRAIEREGLEAKARLSREIALGR